MNNCFKQVFILLFLTSFVELMKNQSRVHMHTRYKLRPVYQCVMLSWMLIIFHTFVKISNEVA